MKKKLKWLFWGVIILSIAGYSLYTKAQPLKAELIKIEPQTIAKTFTEEGKVVSEEEQDIYITQGGKILDLPVKEGDLVKRGDLLLKLDATELNYQIRQLKGQLTSLRGQERQAAREPYDAQINAQELAVEQARLQWEAATKELERAKTLYQEGAISQGALEIAERAVKETANLLAQQEQALKLLDEQQSAPQGTREQFAGSREATQAQIALLEYQKDRATIYAPMEGRVKALQVKGGMVIAPGTPILSLFKPGDYQVEVFLLSEDVALAKPGMKVRVIQESKTGDKVFDGEVAGIAPAAQEKISALGLVEQRVKVTVALKGDLNNLRPGYTMDVEFTTHREKNRLVVPKTVLFPYQGQEALWVVRGGKAQILTVKKGFETDDNVVIGEGLQSGDLIIRNPQQEGLQEGKKVIGS